MEKFINRQDAGQQLAHSLQPHAQQTDTLVLALPRGGVPIGHEIAKELHLPLEVLVVKKLGLPGHEELAVGAITSGGSVVFNHSIIKDFNLSSDILDEIIKQKRHELAEKEQLYREQRPAFNAKDKTIILVDDGAATGATIKVAIKALRQQNPKKIIIALPVATPEAAEELTRLADQLVCLGTPTNFQAVGNWYEDFSQVSDEEVRALSLEN